MTTAPSASAEPTSDDAPGVAPDIARAVLEEQLAGLRRLARIGLAIAEDIGRMTAAAATASESGGEESAETVTVKTAAIDLAFGRVSRAVRLTYAMQTQVVEQLRRIGHIEEAAAAAAERERAELSQARRATVAGVLTRIIRDEPLEAGAGAESGPDDDDDEAAGDLTEAGEREIRERLVAEASECLRDRDRFGDLTNRPVSDVVAEICRDLGISPDWFSLSEESWAQQELRGGMAGAALTTLPPKSEWPPRRPRPVKPRPVNRPPPAARPALPEPPDDDCDDCDDFAPSPSVDTILPRPPPAPAPLHAEPPPPAWPPWEDEDAIARRHALPGELPPPRRPRPRGRPPTY